MRYLAVARFRCLTTIRQATPIYVVVLLPAIIGALIQSIFHHGYEAGDQFLALAARVALFAWAFHALFLLSATELFAGRKTQPLDPTTAPADLMESAPVRPNARFGGEFAGIFVSTLVIHACCMPLLALVAAMSPLPGSVFVWFELVVVALMILSSAAAAWKRIARPTKMAATRNLRSGILFAIIVVAVLYASTQWTQFRDAAAGFILVPSPRAWERLLATIDEPVALAVSIAVLYVVYFLFYYVSSTRDPLRA